MGTDLLRAVATARRGYVAHALPQQAAAISFRVLFSFVPLVALAVAVGDLLLPNDVSERLVDWLIGELAGSPDLEDSVDRVDVGGTGQTSLAGVVALAGLVWGATAMMASIRVAFQTIWQGERRRAYVRGKLLDLVLVLGTGIAAIAGFGLGILSEAVAQLGGDLGDALGLTRAGDVLGEAIGVVASLVITVVVFVALYRVAPPVRPPWRAVWPGAVVGALGFQLVTVAYGWYLVHFGSIDDVYGSLGALLGFLLVVYWGVVAMLVGAELVAGRPDGRP